MALALVLLPALALVGCGSEPSTAERTLSKREYIQRSNDLQAKHRAAFTELPDATRTPATAQRQIAALDALSAGLTELDPPPDWRDEHATMLESLATMRHALVIISRASPANRPVITAQVRRHSEAQQAFDQAVQDINRSR